MTVRKAWPVLGWILASVLLLYMLHQPVGGLLRIGPLLDPWDGLYRTARMAEHPPMLDVRIEGLSEPVTVERDGRGVPHIFAANSWDAVTALGFVVAQDRLFQMQFMSRVAAGRLAELFGPSSVPADQYLRSIGMERAAQAGAKRVRSENSLELQIIDAFARGVNAYISGLAEATLPFEFRLFDTWPERYTTVDALRLMQYFNYDLSYPTDDAAYSILRDRLGEADYAALYPLHSPLYVPIVPEASETRAARFRMPAPIPGSAPAPRPHLPHAEGFQPGKGSNSWAVFGDRSATGAPLLAGDMHLSLTMPSIWYEAHIVTPDMNIYGVLSPGTPLLVEAFNDDVGWVYTNTGTDAVDFYTLELDQSGERYRFDGTWRNLTVEIDTIHVRGAAPVTSTMARTHFGPVVETAAGTLAMRWAAYEENRVLLALWGLAHARSVHDADSALQYWGTPGQNVLFADAAGNVAVRSAGFVPLLKGGESRAGVLDGTTSAAQWSSRIPYAALPAAMNPVRGYLATSNQQPATPAYPYYLGHDWRAAYRSLRLDELLSSKEAHSLEDMKAYQRDVRVVQHALLVPHLDSLDSLPTPAARLQDMLMDWDGEASTDRSEPLVLYTLLDILQDMSWDEDVFSGMPRPRGTTLFRLLQEGSPWLDVVATPMVVEDAQALLRLALVATADTLAARYGSDPSTWRWGAHHKLVARHLTQTPALNSLWSRTYEYPGFDQTVSPGDGLSVTKSASWRMIVDFSAYPPRGYGVYFGGQSGNPFSRFYDMQSETYISFSYYDLEKPAVPGQISAISLVRIRP